MVSGETPTPSARRASRATAARPFGSPLAATKKIGRPPIILEWGSTVIRVGYAEQSLPQHVIPLPIEPFERIEAYNNNNNNNAEAESRWYDVVSPIVRQVFHRIMVDPTARRVVILASPYPLRTWEAAMKQALWNVGVPAVSFLNYLEVVPMAQGWKRGLIVHVGRDESHCLVHVDGHSLPFSYQVVPCGYKAAVKDASKITSQWNETMDKIWLDENNPHSLVVALLKCLEACPTDTRKDVIANLIFCGDTPMIIPDLGRRVALKLKQCLEGTTTTTTESATPLLALQVDDPAMTFVPVSASSRSLKPLAPHVGILSCAPFRADVISWVGASVYSTIWHRYDDHDSHVQWNFAPTKASE